MISFAKMHGCGNDFIVLRQSGLEGLPGPGADRAAWIRLLCDRHMGLGADGLLTYAAEDATHLRMHYWNQDGSGAEMCGNGARCVVRLAYERGEIGVAATLHTDSGVHPVHVRQEREQPWIEVRLGRPDWAAKVVGLRDGVEHVDSPLHLGDETLRVSALDLGNPHAVVFLPDLQSLETLSLETTGRALSEHVLFTRGANASFAAIHSGQVHLRVWERGAGATLACGSASCAAVAAARRLGQLEAETTSVHLPGGVVEVRVDAEAFLWLGGPATLVAEGHLSEELLHKLPQN